MSDLALHDTPDLDEQLPVDPVAAKRFGLGFGIASILLVLLFIYLGVVRPHQLFEGAPITIGEATALNDSIGIVEKMMKIEQRKGNTVVREATPEKPTKENFSQDVTLTVTTPAGVATVYKVRYALEEIPSVEHGDRLVRLYPLNHNGEQLLRDLELPYVAPPTPLTD